MHCITQSIDSKLKVTKRQRVKNATTDSMHNRKINPIKIKSKLSKVNKHSRDASREYL